MATKPLPTPEQLRQLLDYDPDTGALTWRFRSGGNRGDSVFNAMYAGKAAFTAQSNGYKVGRLHGRNFPAHRIAWAIHHGAWPKDQIDHINQVRGDNRIANLREVTNLENHRNRQMTRRNKTGRTGVCYEAKNDRWHAQIGINGKTLHLGWFAKFEDAVAARENAERGLFSENHGKHRVYSDKR